MWQGRQFVVVAAGGHGEAGAATSDAIVAFALPAHGESARSAWDRYIEQPGRHFMLGAATVAAVLLTGLVAATKALRRRRRPTPAGARQS